MQTIIKAKGLVDVKNQTVVDNITLVVDGDKIIAISRDQDIPEVHPDSQVLDLSDKFILPGLINSHLHLCMEAEPHIGRDAEYLNSWKDLAVLTATRNSKKELMSGVTTVRDCGGWNMPALVKAVELGLFEGPRIFHCGRLITMTGGHAWNMGDEADGTDAVLRCVRQNFKEGADFIKLMVTGGGTPHTFPGHASYSVPEIAAAVNAAHQIGKKVAVHARGTAGIKNSIAAGVDCIEHSCFEHPDKTLKFDRQIVEEMAAAGTCVTPTIQLYRNWVKGLILKQKEGTLTPDERETIKYIPKVLEEKYVALRGFLEAGVTCMAGNDAGIPGLEFGTFWGELDTLVEGGMSSVQALVSATLIPAEIMGLETEIGSLEVGKQADIIAVADDPTKNIGTLEQVQLVMKAGDIVKNSIS
jgi:imidazolonepropionase-like amidohydrolase